MKQSLVELVDVILQKLQEHPEKPPTERGLRSWLVRQGYNKGDIEAALKLVKPRILTGTPNLEQRPRSIRMFSALEDLKLAPEARNALVRLSVYELLESFELEMILDRLYTFEGEVGLAELDYLLAWVVLPNRDVEFQQTLYNVLENKEDTLH
jgi:uncharacterized protein Smg (DUF494 family)